MKRREEDKKERIERAIKRKEQRETELAIIKKRAEKLECELKKGLSGEVWMVKWNGIELGDIMGQVCSLLPYRNFDKGNLIKNSSTTLLKRLLLIKIFNYMMACHIGAIAAK